MWKAPIDKVIPTEGTIERLIIDERHTSRVWVYVAKKKIWRLAIGQITELSLRAGEVFDSERADALTRAARITLAVDKALWLLAASSKSEKEVRGALRARGFEVAIIDIAVARLYAAHALNDEAVAESVARRAVEQGWGRRKVQEVLYKKGIKGEAAKEALKSLQEAGDEGQREEVRRVAVKRWSAIAGDPGAARKLWAYLARRGFDSEIISKVVSEVVRPSEEDA